jgi:hypothetical protein
VLELTIEKVRGAILHIHKAGSKIPTLLTVSAVYKLYLTPVKTTLSFGVFIVYQSMDYGQAVRNNVYRYVPQLLDLLPKA